MARRSALPLAWAGPHTTRSAVFANALLIAVAILAAILVGLVARRVLGVPIGYIRSIIVGALVVVASIPFGNWIIRETGVDQLEDGETNFTVVVVVVLLAVSWIFALGVLILVALEATIPTRAFPNPIELVRSAIRRRSRTRRYLQILTIASRDGAGWLLHGRRSPANEGRTTAQQRADALVTTINNAGVTFVKLGQVLSTRRDLVPEPYLSALARLQSNATTVPWPEIEAVLKSELGVPLDTVFGEIDSTPLAAASVAQVHRARLVDGTPVVVKVQRPDARAQVEADVDIIGRLADRAETHTALGREMRLSAMAAGFTTTLAEELDYRVEARNVHMIESTMRDIHAGSPRLQKIAIPSVYSAASTRRVLTMDVMDGSPLSSADERLGALGPEARHDLAQTLMETVIEQILVYGVFHADLHPGNVFIRDDGSLGLIDFGAIGIVQRSQREHLAAFLLSAASDDDVSAADALLLIVDAPEDLDVDAFRHDIGTALTSVQHWPRGEGSIFTMMLDVIRKHHLALPSTLASAFRSFATLEGCLRVIEPDFDFVQRALPFVPELLKQLLALKRVIGTAQAKAAVAAAYAARMPNRIDTIVSKLEDGELSVRVSPFSDRQDRSWLGGLVSRGIDTAVALTAVILAIVLVVAGGGPTLAPGLELFNLLGAVIGLLGFFGILRSMLRSIVGARGQAFSD
ncbi:hypothetical protein C5B99_07625 [Pseudoclavibacter sp. Z016]|nr:hypothetical protein C5B99_07625 [Pseudoclavibacter sp. Z016]